MKIRITPGAILLALVLLFHRDELLPATLLAAAVHECGHLLAAKLLGIRLRLLELDLMGARLYPAAHLPSYRAEMLLAAAGPAASLLLLLIPPLSPFWAAARTASLSLALFNLLPIRDFDGGRVLHALLAAGLGRNADSVLAVTSYLSLLFLFSIAACLLLRYGEDAALAVLSATLFAKLFLSLEGRKPPHRAHMQKK